MLRNYECLLFLNPNMDDAQVTTEINAIEETVKTHGGSVQQKSTPRKAVMGYRIKKKKDAINVYVECSLPAAQVKEVSNALKLRDQVLRFMFVVKDEKAKVA